MVGIELAISGCPQWRELAINYVVQVLRVLLPRVVPCVLLHPRLVTPNWVKTLKYDTLDS